MGTAIRLVVPIITHHQRIHMSYTPPHDSLSCISGGRVVLRHAPDIRHLRDQIARNECVGCEVPGCGFQRHKLSALCRRHYRHWEATGHHTAATIRRGAWRPWVLDASAFVSQQLRLDHAGVAAGISWFAEELVAGGAVARRADPRRPHTGYGVALARLRRAGVGPDDLLARWFAAFAHQQSDLDQESRPGRRIFQSDDHFRHQAAKLLLYPAPIAAPRWAQGNTDDDDSAPSSAVKFNPSVRKYTFERVNAALGVLALRAAEEINRRLLSRVSAQGTPHPVSRVNADTEPFFNVENSK